MSLGTGSGRRLLRFESLDDIVCDAELVLVPGGSQIGSWTPAQNVQHVARGIRLSVDGYGGFRPNMALKVLGPLLKNVLLKKTFKAGTNAPAGLGEVFRPDDNVTSETAMDELRSVVRDVGERGFIARNPVIGTMSHDQWVTLHCRHAELHFGFLVPAM